MLKFIFRRKTGFLLLFVILCAAGVFLVTRLPILLYPQTQRPRVFARISHPGVSAVDFTNEYADSIESRLMGIEGVDILDVSYENDRSHFILTFDWQTDSEKAKSDAESAMNTIEGSLPSDFSTFVGFFAGENAGFLMMGVSSKSTSPEELFRQLDTSVKPMMNQITDAESVDFYNVEDLSVEVILRQFDMLAYGVTVRDVENALLTGYRPESVGSLRESDTSYTIRFKRNFEDLYDLENIVVLQKGDIFVTVKDIADISIAYELPSRIFVMDGQRGIRVTASPVDGGNVRVMSEEVQEVLNQALQENLLPEDTIFQRFIDPADYINRSINNVVTAALLGAAFAMLIVLLSLGELRNTLLIGISLPVTLVLSFILLYFFDVSLNLISLGGIALAVGMIIDSSIVVMENIHRLRFAEARIHDNAALKDIIMRAVREVRAPVIASTLTSVLVFFPISFTAPLTNAILGDQAKSVIFALCIALIVAITLIPLLAYILYRTRKSKQGQEIVNTLRGIQRLSVPVFTFFKKIYTTLLAGLIRRKWSALLFIFLSFGLLGFSLYRILPLIPKEIISPPLSDQIIVSFKSTSIDDPNQIIDEVIPVIKQRVSDSIGEYVELNFADVSSRFSRYFIKLKSTDFAEDALNKLQKEFVSDNDWYYNVMMWDPAELPLPRTMDLQISVHGDDPAQLVTLLEQIRDIVNDTELYTWAFTNPSTKFEDEISMTARDEIIQGFPEFSERSLLTLIKKILGGTTPVEFEHEQYTVSVSAEYPEELINSRQKLENFLIPFQQGTIPLKHFFDFEESTGVSGMASENGERIFRLYAKMPMGTPAVRRGEFEDQIRKELEEKLEVPSGYSLTFENPQEELDNAIRSLFVALGASVILIYLLLAFQFNSLVIPLVIIVTVPLGFIGVIFSLYLFKSTLSLNSMLGTILLGGIVVNNAIIMIDFYLRNLKNHEKKLNALIDAAGIRFTPIIITSLTTICGMLPIALGFGEGANIIQPLGIAVSGGLFISTLFTLFMVPSILSMINIKPVPEN